MGGGDVTHHLAVRKLKGALLPQDSRKLSRQTALERTLRKLVKEGGFRGAVIVSWQGLPLALEGRWADHELAGAVAAQFKRVAERAQAEPEEILVRDGDGNCVVNRFFSVGGEDAILVVLMRPQKNYRRLMNEAIQEIKKVWNG